MASRLRQRERQRERGKKRETKRTRLRQLVPCRSSFASTSYSKKKSKIVIDGGEKIRRKKRRACTYMSIRELNVSLPPFFPTAKTKNCNQPRCIFLPKNLTVDLPGLNPKTSFKFLSPSSPHPVDTPASNLAIASTRGIPHQNKNVHPHILPRGPPTFRPVRTKKSRSRARATGWRRKTRKYLESEGEREKKGNLSEWFG